jgi:hypothetical protein
LPENAVDRDQMLTDVGVYWLTRTAGSSAQAYCEGYHSGLWGPASAIDGAHRRGGVSAGCGDPTLCRLLPGDIRAFFRRLRA